MASHFRTDGRGTYRREPRSSAAQPGLDGSKRADPRGDWAGAVSNVAHIELMKEALMAATPKASIRKQRGSSVLLRRDGRTAERDGLKSSLRQEPLKRTYVWSRELCLCGTNSRRRTTQNPKS